MVTQTTCPDCGIVTSNCFGSTGNRHKNGCAWEVKY